MATQVGEAVVKLTFDGKDVQASLSKTSSQIEKSGKSSGMSWGNAWSVAAGSLISKAVSKISGMITSNLDKAISRVDIINNFPRMMSNMGISAEASQKSITKLSDKLMGLPTSLQSGVSAVERFTSKNGDVRKSTDLFLALNNAILAGGAPMEQQATAMEQLAQAYAKGKPDMMEWRSAMTAMPAQLNQVAEAMGFGKNGADALGQALRNGDVTMDDFMNTITRLNTEGVNGFKTFEEQARNSTGGIGTALANVQNRIAMAIGKVIDYIGQTKISDTINNISKHFGDLADKVIDLMKFLGQNKWILEFAGTFVATLIAIGTALKIINAVMAVSPITWIIAGIAAIVAGIVLLVTHFDSVSAWIHENLPWLEITLQTIGSFIGMIGEHIGRVIGIAAQLWNDILWPIFQAIANFLGPVIGQIFNNLITTINVVVGVFTAVFNTVWTIFEVTLSVAIKVFSRIGSFISGVVNNIKGFFSALGGAVGKVFNGIADMIKNVFGSIAGIIKAPINGIINGINGVLSSINSITVPDWVPFIGGSHTSFGMIPQLARGGYADGATTAIIGEAGKEVVLPLENNTDNWAGLLAGELAKQFDRTESVGGREIIVNMTNTINSDMDAEDIGRKLMESIRRAA